LVEEEAVSCGKPLVGPEGDALKRRRTIHATGFSPKAFASVKHPVTGDVLACEQNRDVYGAAVYAACKNEIESRGYVRVGTEQREILAKTGVDYTTPRPLPAK